MKDVLDSLVSPIVVGIFSTILGIALGFSSEKAAWERDCKLAQRHVSSDKLYDCRPSDLIAR